MSTPSLFYGSNAAFLEDLFERYQADPYSVSQDWRAFFASMNPLSAPTGATEGVTSNAIVEHMLTQGLSEVANSAADAQSKVSRLIQAYRMLGHKSAWLSPLAQQPELQDELTLAGKGLAESQLDDVFMTDGVLPEPTASLRDILTALQRTYASTVGVQYANLPNETERNWLRERMEHVQNHPTFTPEHKKNIFTGLMKADRFEKFLHTKFVGMKRFSVEGGDSLIPMLETLTDMAGEYGVSDIVLGMAHRGRLNVLCNIMGKPFEDLFAAFADNAVYAEGDSSAGDVKYHMGKSIDITTKGGQVVHMSLLSNPSHLEAVNPVVEGSVRAKQTLKGDTTRERVIPLLIHGDAAFCGQGIVPETLNLMGLEGYATGGTIHIVINNQIGYTAEPKETFSGDYCTDVARILQIPIFHVNGDDPEACVHVMRLAMAYREEFKRDVVIDLVCYRRHGHNEGDDPTFTQPVMYQNIRTHAVPAALYRQQLAREGVLSEVDAGALEQSYVDVLTQAHTAATSEKKVLTHEVFGGVWQNLKSQHEVEP
jgi:2-oxoglutarate dehydrogenase E1 component